MARRYFLNSTASNLTGGADFNLKMYDRVIGSSSSQVVSLAPLATETSYAFTELLTPGRAGSVVGDYTISINISTANNLIYLSTQVARINNLGGVQQTSSTSGEQLIDTTGAKVFTLTGVDLGTFNASDRFRVSIIARNNQDMTNSWALAVNSINSYVTAPFRIRTFNIT